jgi:Protein of unknown function (DUF3300)
VASGEKHTTSLSLTLTSKKPSDVKRERGMIMRTKQRWARQLAWGIILLLAMPPGSFAQESGAAVFKQEELDQILAPIALYPDSLVSQILIASTYPLEVVQADRWAKQNPSLKGDPLTKALEAQNWDPSVKSLVNFPQVLTMMSEKLDWTQKLGDAFLEQEKDVMDTVQSLRAKAEAAGNLKTTSEQKVIVEQKVIRIEPANPQVIYVPAYNPTVVYGAWPYPAYPPYYYYPPGYVAARSAFWFASGVALGSAWGYAWGSPNWHGGNVKYNYNQNITINNNINRNKYAQQLPARGDGNWQHNAEHRKGVSYRDQGTAQKYNRGTNNQAASSREAYRGRAEQGRQNLAGGGASQPGGGQTAQRAGAGDRASAGQSGRGGAGATADRAGGGAASRGGASDRASTGQLGGGSARGTAGSPGGAFEGMNRGGSSTSAASQRGSASRSSVSGGGGSAGRGSSGGGGRAGGGGSGGGGGGGRGGRR